MALSTRDLDRMMGDPWRREIPPCCPTCGYDLSGTGGNRCPECGITHVRKNVDRLAGEVEAEIRRLRYVNDHVRTGVKFAGVGLCALLLGLFRAEHTPSFDLVGRFVAVICGFFAVALGLNVARVKRLPPWAFDYIPSAPDFGLGVMTALVGLTLIVLSLAIS